MQEHLKIAYSRKALETFGAVEKRDIADVFQTDFTDEIGRASCRERV